MGPKPSVTLRLYIYNDQNYAVESTGCGAPPAHGLDGFPRGGEEAFQRCAGGTTSRHFEEYFGTAPNRPSRGVPAPEILCGARFTNIDTEVFSVLKAGQRYAFDSEWRVCFLFDRRTTGCVCTNRTDGDQISLFTSRLLSSR